MDYAKQCSCHTLDLPQSFIKLFPNEISGRKLFLDNCHMTSTGISLSMNLATQFLLDNIESLTITNDILTPSNVIGADIEAKAYFSAAIYNAHIGDQPYNTLHEDLSVAYDKDPTIAKSMHGYINLASCKVPWVLNKNYAELISSQFTIMAQMDECKIMDIPIVSAMLQVLEEKENTNLSDQINKLRIHHFGPNNGPENLLESYFRETSYVKSMGNSINDWLSKEKAYISATDYITKFYVIADDTNSLTARIELRIPQDNVGDVKIFINNQYVTGIKAEKSWSLFTFIIEKDLLSKDGINELIVQWPISKIALPREFSRDDFLSMSKYIFGDIYQFYISI